MISLKALTSGTCTIAADIHRRWLANDIMEMLAIPKTTGWISYDGDTPAGLILVRAPTNEAEILTLDVIPAYRQLGHARTLMARIMTDMARTNVRKCHLEVAETNIAARKLYESLGFEVSGRRRGYYRTSSGRMDALLLSLTFNEIPPQNM